MSSTVDNRVVGLGFDNKQFEAGTKQSIESLNALKKGLQLDESARSLANLASAGRAFNLGPIADGVQSLQNRFSTFGIIGMTILQNLTNKAMEFGHKMWQAITGPAKTGFAEYETQMNAIQTIMANTASKGTTMDEVNAVLDELNTYADKTIYNFSEMTKNIGTFTAAGIDLKTSADAIKGIANLAAVSGSNSQQAAVAMYQLSQALASGTVKLMDWNSVVNAGMGGQVFQDALKETARLHGIAIDNMIKREGSFRNTLQEGWLTSEILTETLSKFTGDLTAAQLETMGYTEDQIAGILKLGQTANDAATKVKTLTQLKDTLKEALGSGWAQTWKIVVGDFQEAKTFFTYLSDMFGGIITRSSDVRNEILQTWKDLGGRTLVIAAIRKTFEAIVVAVAPIKDAFKEIFPTEVNWGKKLYDISFSLMLFAHNLKMGGETIEKVKTIFKGFFAIFDIAIMALTAFFGLFDKRAIGGGIESLGKSLFDNVVRIAEWILNLRDALKAGNTFVKGIENIKSAIATFQDKVAEVVSKIRTEFDKLKEAFESFKVKIKDAFTFGSVNTSGITDFFEKIKIRFAPLETLVKVVAVVIGGLIKLLEKSAPILVGLGSWIGKILGGLGTAIFDAVSTLDFSNLFDALNAGFLGAFILALQKFVTKGTSTLGSIENMFQGISGVLDDVRASLQAYQQNLKSKTLLNIAIAVGVLAASLLVISLIDSKKLTTALASVTALFADLVLSMQLLGQGTGGAVGGAMGLAISLMAMSTAILLISGAIKVLSTMDKEELNNGLLSLGAISAGVVALSRTMSGAKGFAASAISLMLFGVALKIIVDVVKELGNIDVDVLQKGLVSIGILMAELAAFTQLSGKFGIGGGLGILAFAAALLVLSISVEKFGEMDIGVLKQGLIAMGAILAELGLFILLTGDSKKVMATAIAMTILGGAILIFTKAIEILGKMTWEEIGKGLAGIAGALLAIVLAVNLMPKNIPFVAVSLVIIAGAIYILANSLTLMSKMTWEEIAKGLATLAGAFLIIGVAMYAMQTSIGGALALVVVAGALAILTPVLKTLGGMGLTEIALALGALAGVFIILGIAGALLTPTVPTLLGLGIAIMLLGAAIALIGGGILLFSMGLAALAVSGVAGATALVAIVGVLLGIVPMVITAIVEGLKLFSELIIGAAPVFGEALIVLIETICKVIIDSVPDVVEALQVVLTGLIQLIRDNVPPAIDAFLFLIAELLKSLAASIPDFTQSAFDILLGFLKGIRDNIGEVVIVVGEIITEFLDALALELPKIIQSGVDFIISFIDGIAAAIETSGPDLTAAVGRLASAIIKGLTDGLLGGVNAIVAAIGNIGSSIIGALKTLLGITSPSKVMIAIGIQVIKGLLIGLRDRANSIKDATEDLGDRAVSGMSRAIRRINDALNADINQYPTITPILDLTDLQNGSRAIDRMFINKGIKLSESMNRLASVSGKMSQQNGSGERMINPNPNTVITFNQTNNSPKALSSFDIYKDTRNQLLMLKGLVISK